MAGSMEKELQQQLDHEREQYEREKQEWIAEREKLKREIQKLKSGGDEDDGNSSERRVLPQKFWVEVYDKMRTDPDWVKSLVKDKQLKFNDVDKKGKNLFVNAAYYGEYEMTQFCINLGFDLDFKDNKGYTALYWARSGGYYHIEQLLMFAELNVSIGNEVKEYASTMLQQGGISRNLMTELTAIGDVTMELFTKSMMELMVRVIKKKLSFSDTMLNFCFDVFDRNNQNPLKTELWATIKETCEQVIGTGSHTDWYWLKNVVLTSTMWYRDVSKWVKRRGSKEIVYNTKKPTWASDRPPHYLYYELLKWVTEESASQLKGLEDNLNVFATEYPNDWERLTTFKLPTYYDAVRQDSIPNGIVSRFTYSQLSETSDAAFNSPQFYDYNQYLSQLVLLAKMVDDSFHESIQTIFEIDKLTHLSKVEFFDRREEDEKKFLAEYGDSKTGDGYMYYSRGPVKLIERARYKAQNDYVEEPYPASACVLDFNRCALIFNDISTMLAAIDHFLNKIKFYQSGSIIGIARDKNGFIEYIQETQYADVKINVVIAGTHNSVIGEVQFLLQVMKDFKDKAHNLYTIERKREGIETSVPKILPMLTHKRTQVFIAGNMGTVKHLCKVLVIDGNSKDELMQLDPNSRQTILHRICAFDHLRALKFIKSLMSEEEFVEYLFQANHVDIKAVEFSVRYCAPNVTEWLYTMKAVKARYMDDLDLLGRLLQHLFKKNEQMVDFIFTELNLNDPNRLSRVLKHTVNPPKMFHSNRPVTYHLEKIMVNVARYNSIKSLHKLIKAIGGEKVFIEHFAFDVDQEDKSILECAVEYDNKEILEYLLNMKEVHAAYQKSDVLLFRILYHAFGKAADMAVTDLVLKSLQPALSAKKIVSLLGFRSPTPRQKLPKSAHKYHEHTLLGHMAIGRKMKNFAKLRQVIDDDEAFADAVCKLDADTQRCPLSDVVATKNIEFVQQLMEIEVLRQKCAQNKQTMFSVFSTLQEKWDDEMCKAIVQKLELNRVKLMAINASRTEGNIDISKILGIVNQ